MKLIFLLVSILNCCQKFKEPYHRTLTSAIIIRQLKLKIMPHNLGYSEAGF